MLVRALRMLSLFLLSHNTQKPQINNPQNNSTDPKAEERKGDLLLHNGDTSFNDNVVLFKVALVLVQSLPVALHRCNEVGA